MVADDEKNSIEIPDTLLHVQSVWTDAEQKGVLMSTAGAEDKAPQPESAPRYDRA